MIIIKKKEKGKTSGSSSTICLLVRLAGWYRYIDRGDLGCARSSNDEANKQTLKLVSSSFLETQVTGSSSPCETMAGCREIRRHGTLVREQADRLQGKDRGWHRLRRTNITSKQKCLRHRDEGKRNSQH